MSKAESPAKAKAREQAAESTGPSKGCLEIGSTGAGQVVINHAELDRDKNGVGHIVFSPAEARKLARILAKSAARAARERVTQTAEAQPTVSPEGTKQ